MTTEQHLFDAARRAPVLQHLPTNRLDGLLFKAQRHCYRKNDIICAQGDPAEHFFFVEQGWVSSCKYTIDGDEVVIDVQGPDNCLHMLPALLNTQYSTELKAATGDVVVVRLPSQDLRKIAQGEPKAREDMLQYLYMQMQQMETALECVKSRSAKQRIIDFLIEEAEVCDGRASVLLRYDKAVISSKIGIKPESFSRVLNRLRAWGVHSTGSIVNIEDLERLKTAAAAADA